MADTFEVRGLRELNRTLRRADIPKAVGQAHKTYGTVIARRVNAQADPRAVGRGAGSELRASAAKRELKLRVGGKHRANPSLPRPNRSSSRWAYAPWGRTYVGRVGERRPRRPYIKDIARREFDPQEYLDAIETEIGLQIT